MPIKTLVILISKWAGLIFWIALGGLRLVDAWQNALIIPTLLAAQSALIAWLLITRNPQAVEAPWPQKVIAWASALLPLAMRIHRETLVGQIITGLGLLLVLWALGTLGRSFGIAPADRGLVKEGPYRLIRHPMYLGELVSLAGAVTGDPTTWNVVLMMMLLLSLLLRIRWEERAVFHYETYAGRVCWRLIPGIW